MLRGRFFAKKGKKKKFQMMVQLLGVGCKTRRLGRKVPPPQPLLQRPNRGGAGNAPSRTKPTPQLEIWGPQPLFQALGQVPSVQICTPRPCWHLPPARGDAVCLSRFFGQTFSDSGKVYLGLAGLHKGQPVPALLWSEGGEPGRAPSSWGTQGLLEGRCPGQASASAAPAERGVGKPCQELRHVAASSALCSAKMCIF